MGRHRVSYNKLDTESRSVYHFTDTGGREREIDRDRERKIEREGEGKERERGGGAGERRPYLLQMTSSIIDGREYNPSGKWSPRSPRNH